MKVLDGIDSLDYRKEECTFAGSVIACMKFLKDDVSDAFVKAVEHLERALKVLKV